MTSITEVEFFSVAFAVAVAIGAVVWLVLKLVGSGEPMSAGDLAAMDLTVRMLQDQQAADIANRSHNFP